ncbi:hypothetical protein [Nonomuraea sp. NPDC049400]|uniref:hypothetical protein n=1 Tax=Nonomuraea sp. NPDC049400 TaxID=3364352 RepID=UPI0037B95E36
MPLRTEHRHRRAQIEPNYGYDHGFPISGGWPGDFYLVERDLSTTITARRASCPPSAPTS